MRSLKESEEKLRKCEETEYKCIKCRDMTFIIDDGVIKLKITGDSPKIVIND